MNAHQQKKLLDGETETVSLLKLFANEHRFQLLRHLLDGEKSVGDLDELTRIGQPLLSQQLAKLRQANVVLTRRDGKRILYSLNDSVATRLLESICAVTRRLQGWEAQPVHLQPASGYTHCAT